MNPTPLLLALALAPLAAAAETPPPAATPAPESRIPPDQVFSERLDVSLASLVVRVIDRDGLALAGLGLADFRLFAGKVEIPIEAIEWSGPPPLSGPEAELAAPEPGREPPPELPAGKLVVFFVQADFHPSRLSGQIRMLQRATSFLGTLGPFDRAAVVSYDSHLKLRQDFTTERDRLEEALARAIRTGDAPFPRRGREPSLARHLDPEAAAGAARPERALALVARALVHLPGEKVVVFLGWGLGERTPIGVRLPAAYQDAVAAFAAAHASVFALDVTDADYHTLEVGMKQIAVDTGGTYAKTHLFPDAAVERLAGAIAGQYVLFFRPELAPAGSALRVELAPGREGEVLAAPRRAPS